MHRPIPKIKQKREKPDILVYFFSLTTPLFMVPQAVAIFQAKNALHVSLATWSYFLVADIVWITYGLKHNLKPFVVCHMFYFIVETFIVIGILLYS